ncbi:hypothetical protein BC936DRAFT_143020 [Jimgerdemannia flammicorona]|uniref:Uncharacterized protein n=1 Tax=Jimgerdemannia flammicorona TaxID=994334 RepID=A0A432ZZY5_9FUNG|nr:hypothetical protein BC936DRAFT_143020 [Jimgerdemannia flammicorona]
MDLLVSCQIHNVRSLARSAIPTPIWNGIPGRVRHRAPHWSRVVLFAITVRPVAAIVPGGRDVGARVRIAVVASGNEARAIARDASLPGV